jgi:hypothetical protein
MTWIIKIIYQPNDRSKPDVGIQQMLTDTGVEHAGFDVRLETFKRLVATIDKELKDENRRG